MWSGVVLDDGDSLIGKHTSTQRLAGKTTDDGVKSDTELEVEVDEGGEVTSLNLSYHTVTVHGDRGQELFFLKSKERDTYSALSRLRNREN